MSYLGNSPVLSQQEYRNIDDISGSFNGSTTSFALLVNGVAPVPAPQSSNQCLISVNGVIQKPDDTGATGFRLSGGNIIFSAAPTGGQAFFGVILAGADYIYAGQNYPDGTVSAPSITFAQDLDTGFYRSGAGEVKFTANGANTVTLSSNNLTAPSFIPTSSSAPTNGVYLPAANTVAIATNSTGKLFINSSGQVGIGTSSPGYSLEVSSGSNDATALFNSTSVNGSHIRFASSGTVKNYLGCASGFGAGDHDDLGFRATDNHIWLRGSTELMRLTSTGLGIGTTSPSARLHVNGTNAGIILQHAGNSSYSALYTDTNNTLQFVVGGGPSEAARFDASGRLLVGTSSAIAALEPSIQTARPSGAFLALGRDDTSITDDETLGALYFYGNQGSSWSNSARIEAKADAAWGTNDYPSKLVFSTTADGASSPTEQMRITNGGIIAIGNVAATNLNTIQSGTPTSFWVSTTGTTSNPPAEFYGNSTGNRFHICFSNSNGVVGSIRTNATATAYLTSSDYRLKENVVAVTDGITRLQQLKPSRFNFIADPDVTVDGFLAHEAQTVVPECVSGTKDEVDENGNPIYQGIDQSKLVPLLTAALQEAIGEIESLKARVAALESA